MSLVSQIPVFNLFGETSAFPDVVHCEAIRDRAGLLDWEITPHRHSDMAQVFFMQSGRAQVRLDGSATEMGDGCVLFVPPRVVHGFRFRRGAEGLVLSIPMNVLSGIAAASDGLARSLSRPFQGQASDLIAGLARQIHDSFCGTAGFRTSLLVALSQALLVAVADQAAQGSAASDSLNRRRMLEFDRLIAAHLSRGWTLADYAQALAITPGHLNRICRASSGQSASRHLETAVMTEARRLLAFTRLSVAEIGYRLRFDDPPYFSRRFRAVTGETPSAYRARFGG